jgi:two-component system, OmpR family, aerobic respiration control sensor histidine kinase ArcB
MFSDATRVIEEILKHLPCNVFWKATDGKYEWCNNRAAWILGLKSADDIKGKKNSEILPIHLASIADETDRITLETKQEYCAEEKGIDMTGNPAIYFATKAPIFNKNGELEGLLGVALDITELKNTQEALTIAKEKAEAANQAKTEFLENMRHDIRTPLTGIIGCAQLIKSQAGDAEKVAEYAEDLIQSSDALLEFLNKILDACKIATGEIPHLKKKFDLHNILQSIVGLNKSFAAKKNLGLSLEYDKKLPTHLIGDPVRLQRVVLELISNALTFTQKGQIEVVAKLKTKKRQRVVLELKVRDTGIGIPEEKREEIFVRFKRLTPSYQGIYKGLGLGLALVKQFIDDLNGEIYIATQVQQGSCFTCLIPLQVPLTGDNKNVENISIINLGFEIAKSVQNPIQSVRDDIQCKKILLVEDDKIAAKVAQIILSELNCVIDVACDAKTALKRLQEQSYQLIFMDIGLPDSNGIALTRCIRLQHLTIPIIGLTAHIDTENRQHCLNAGMSTVILKPLKKATAVELLNAFIPNEVAIDNPLQISKLEAEIVSGPAFDFAVLNGLLKDEKLIQECLNLMISMLNEDLAKLPHLNTEIDWEMIRSIAHKWKGSASYCGAYRLEQACQLMETYLQIGCLEEADRFYRTMIQEMEAVQKDLVRLQYLPAVS